MALQVGIAATLRTSGEYKGELTSQGDICITFIQRRHNVFDVVPTLYKFYTNVKYKEEFTSLGNICITFIQCWTNVEDVVPTLYKCYTKLNIMENSHLKVTFV